MNKSDEKAAAAYSAQGYICIGCLDPCVVGDIIQVWETTDGDGPVPLRITGESNREEYERQNEMLSALDFGVAKYRPWRYYYRAEAAD